MNNIVAKIFIFFIKIYQCTISKIIVHKCAFFPSCSVYTIEAIKSFGPIKGSILGIKRIFRCRSINMGKIDNVPLNIKGDYKWLI